MSLLKKTMFRCLCLFLLLIIAGSRTISNNITQNIRPIPRLDSAIGKGFDTYFFVFSNNKT